VRLAEAVVTVVLAEMAAMVVPAVPADSHVARASTAVAVLVVRREIQATAAGVVTAVLGTRVTQRLVVLAVMEARV
jgi:hypothetical protein